MSGGANKKKVNKTEGWEVAGSEFYQESYPSNLNDFDVLQQNPKHLTTLLPSKQNRAAATIRIRNNTDTRTVRRQQSMRRESTVRRASMAAEVQVAMMPDLSQNLSNEETTWQEIRELKAMPIPMAQKREQKAKLQNEPNLLLQGIEQFKWRFRKMLEKFEMRLKETYQKLELWRGTLKNIEGNFGTGVVAFFLLIKWLMFLNLSIFFLQFLFIILPMIYNDEIVEDCIGDKNSTECCTAMYFNSSSESHIVLDLFQGRGWMEKTLFFYGKYTNHTIQYYINSVQMYYNLPLAYITVPIVYFFLSLVAIVRAAAKGFKERLVEGEGQFYQYCNTIFCSWDFCIDNGKSAAKKQEAIFKEIKSCLEVERLEEERKSRTRDEKTKLIIIRVIVNILVMVIWLTSAAAIYFIFEFTTNILSTYNRSSIFLVDSDGILRLVYEFLPSLSIVLLNMVVPFFLQYLVKFENYSSIFVVRLTLIRTIFLRLFSLFVLYASIYKRISCPRKMDECASFDCQTPMCWETFVGQQMYKLAITDFAIHIFMTFVINFFRSQVGKLENGFAKMIGEQYFDLPKHALDVIYLQTVCWFGSFYAPLLPAMFTIIFFAMFYIKKFACLVNSKPCITVYRVSRSNSMFMIGLLISFLFALLPVVFSIAEIFPSKSCGPFRGLDSIWEIVITAFHEMPYFIQNVVFFTTTAGFGIPMFIILSLALYYYMAVTSANRHMVTILKHQLVLEGHDKQFLLEKLSSFIKQQQKRARQPEAEQI